jgi:hypothetical protein
VKKILQAYDMKNQIKKPKLWQRSGETQEEPKLLQVGKMTEQVNFFKFLGHSISVHKLNKNLEENTWKNSKLNGVIIRHFQRDRRSEI